MKKKKILFATILTIFTCFISINYVKAAGTTSDIVVCGNLGDPGIPAGIPAFTRGLYNLVKLIVPVAIIIFGMLDFTKAVMASKEQDMKEYQQKFIRRVITGVAIFLVLAIVNALLRAANFSDSNSMLGCLSCLSTTESACTNKKWKHDSKIKYNIEENDNSTDDCVTRGVATCNGECVWNGSYCTKKEN